MPPIHFAVVDERNDHADALAIGDFEHFVERAKAFFVELAGREDVDRLAHVGAFAEDADHVGPHDLAAHLADRFERVFDFEFIRPAPGVRLGEREGVLDHQQVRDVERDEAVAVCRRQAAGRRGG